VSQWSDTFRRNLLPSFSSVISSPSHLWEPIRQVKKYSSPYNRQRRPRRIVQVYINTFFNLGARWGVWLTSNPCRFTPEKKTPGTHCMGRWVDPRADLDGCRENRLHRDSISRPSSTYRVGIPTELPRHTTTGILNLMSLGILSGPRYETWKLKAHKFKKVKVNNIRTLAKINAEDGTHTHTQWKQGQPWT
jgi:hypothetical protein